jgi:hypothetical protein
MIESEYAVSHERAAQDVENFLHEMQAAELVMPVAAHGSDVSHRTELREIA